MEIDEFLKERSRNGLLRGLKPAPLRGEGKIWFENKAYIDFSSNDYLGLSSHPGLIEASREAVARLGASSGASRLLSGDLAIHHQLEEELADFKNKEAALVFNSGYQANLGIISSLYTKGDCIFSDRLNHASIIDGILLSGARILRFRHNHIGDLELLLKKERGKFRKALIITEGVFSMDGDMPPLKALVRLKEKYHCQIFVDEAHATGIFGKNGSGIVEAEGLDDQVDFIMGTFSKAMGSFGAYLASSKKVIDYLINSCRSFIYSTALPPAVIAANLASLEFTRSDSSRREQLLESAGYLRNALRDRGFEVKGDSQIIPLIIGDTARALNFSARLQKKGYWVMPIRPPTVPAGQARLRFSLNFYHSKEILEKLIDEIQEIEI